MKKRFLVIFFSIVAVAALACGIAACDTKENGDTKSDPGYEVTEPSDTETSGKGSSDDSETKGETVSVTSVSLDKVTLSMGVADTYTLVATVLPEDATNKEVTWSSSDEFVATVSGGVVTAVSEGTAVVTAVTADGGKVSTCIVTVLGFVISVDSVSLDKNTFTMETGGTYTLTATVLPGNATNKQVTWSSSDEAVVTVSDGVVTAVSEGTAAVSAVTVDGGKVATCIVTVSENVVTVTSVNLDESSISLEVGGTCSLMATVLPEDATNNEVTWSSSDESVVTVSDGLVTAVSEGTAVVTVVTMDGGNVATCIATVTRSYEGFLFEEYGNGYALIGYTGSDTVLVVPAEYNGKSVIAIGAMPIDTTLDTLYVTGDAFYENDKIREVILPDSIRTINVGAFAYSSVTAVTIPSGCRAIYDYVFYGCKNLKTVTFNGGTITGEMFTGCDSVENIVVGEDAVYSDGVFSSFANLKTLSVANLNTTAKALFIIDDVYSCPDGFETLTITDQRISTNSDLIADCSFEILLLNKYPIDHIYVEGETEVYIDEFDYGNYTLVLVRTDGVPEYVDFVPDYISSEDQSVLKTIGEHSLTVVYEEVSCTFTINLSEHQFDGLTFEDEIFVYDGTLKYVYVSGYPDGAEVTYSNNGNTEVGEYVITAVITKEYYTALTLTATVTIVQPSYSITYVLGKDEAINNNPTEYEYGVALTLNSPTYDYYSFVGWYLDSEFTQEISTVEAGYYGDIVLYAKWISVFIMSNNTIIGVTEEVKSYTDLVIPEKVEGVEVMEISEGILSGCSYLESITVPFVGGSANATMATPSTLFGYIFGTSSYAGGTATNQYYQSGSYVTYYIPSELTSVTVMSGEILYGSFGYCTSLTSIVIADGMTSIGDWAFSSCRSLTSIDIPDSVTSIGDWAFYWTSLTSIDIPDGVTSIGSNAFSSCESLTSVTMGNSVTSIGGQAFYYCTSLTSIDIPDGVSLIGSSTFYNCTSLMSIKIPESVTSIGTDAFAWCTSLTSIDIPEGVTSIGIDAFAWCTSLTSIDIPEGVTSIGSQAFIGCGSLASIDIPDSVTSIGDGAFRGCTSLTSIDIPDSVTSIGSHTFYNCTSLISIDIPDSVTSIGSYAFYNCTSLTSIDIPAGVTSIDSYVFYNCISLTSIVIPDFVIKIGDYAFYYCRTIKSITIPDSVTSLGAYAFYSCTYLESVTMGSKVTSIGPYAFASCSSLTSITIPDSISSIGTYAFYACTYLTEINFNAVAMDDLSSGNNVFNNAGKNGSGITVTIGASVTKIPAYLFCPVNNSSNAPNITNVIFEDNSQCTSIGNDAFCYCSSLTSITIPDSVTSIDYWAFYNCTSLKTVTMGSGITSIGYNAFYNCTSLKTVYFSGNSSEWSEISKDSSNYHLTSATIYFYSELEPEEDGNFWHYVDGEIVVWTQEEDKAG